MVFISGVGWSGVGEALSRCRGCLRGGGGGAQGAPRQRRRQIVFRVRLDEGKVASIPAGTHQGVLGLGNGAAA